MIGVKPAKMPTILNILGGIIIFDDMLYFSKKRLHWGLAAFAIMFMLGSCTGHKKNCNCPEWSNKPDKQEISDEQIDPVRG